MTETYFGLYPHDSTRAPFVLRRMVGDRLAVMDEYADLVCPTCRKVNERAALARGVLGEVVVRSRRPILPSDDNFFLLDERARRAFETILPGELDYFPVPSGAYSVACAKSRIEPAETNPGVRFASGRCKACHRPREVVWGPIRS